MMAAGVRKRTTTRWPQPKGIKGEAGPNVKIAFFALLMTLHNCRPIEGQRTSRGPSIEFSSYTKVRPQLYHGRSKRELVSSTKEDNGDLHAEVLKVGLEIDGSSRILDLRLNRDLIPVGFMQMTQNRGAYRTHTPSKVELCHYQGNIRGVPGSWVALSTCQGLKGVIFDGENLHHIQPTQDSLQASHYLYKQSDLITNHTCGYKGTNNHIDDESNSWNHSKRISRHKREASETIRGPYNANRQSRYVELVFVIDRSEYIALGENLTKVQQHCKDIANIINALYTPLNIFIALVGIEVWTERDEITLMPNGDMTLSNFLKYRRERLVKKIPNDNAQLLTKVQFAEGIVGKALKGPICTYEFSGGVNVDHSTVVSLVAATVAHEMGHNFGMEHDTSECKCPEERCIMAPASGSSGPTHWSSCSLDYLALAFEHGMDYCLRKKPTKLLDSPSCGNGFVEPGEQCDCGLPQNCDNTCCNAVTCMLFSNASCATGECCDLTTCKPKKAGSECRSSDRECDLPEYCTGQSEYCPKDVFKIDGEACNMGRAFCYEGSCRTHNDQCKLLWGPTGSSSDNQCYDINNKGNKNGNCGYNRTLGTFIKCRDDNIMCGMLHCKHLNERLEFGMESVATLSHYFINSEGKIIPCRSAIVDLGINQVDPGLAPDGAKCAPGKMCINQKCMPVADLRRSSDKGCANNCSGNGICNSLGHCHCNRGFKPPDCLEPGFGGSEDSGPAEDPNARSEFIMALYIIFLGIIPTVALASFMIWYNKNYGNLKWKKGPISAVGRGNKLPIKTIDRSMNMPRSIETIDSSIAQDSASASLLPKSDTDDRFNNHLFGHFKGFTITPIQNSYVTNDNAESSKPSIIYLGSRNVLSTTVPIQTNPRTAQKTTSFRAQTPEEDEVDCKPIVAPALPPPNVGSTPRLLISDPVLSATTCTSFEVSNPKMVPTRPAPAPPINATSIESYIGMGSRSFERAQNSMVDNADKKSIVLERSNSTINKIASMLHPISGIVNKTASLYGHREERNTNTLPRSSHHKANKIVDRDVLRSLKISNPILQKGIELSSPTIEICSDSKNIGRKSAVMRTQSMRTIKVSQKPAINSFGSMRRPIGPRRPSSVASHIRPTSPPPVPPIKVKQTANINCTSSEYQQPTNRPISDTPNEVYDDCMNVASVDAPSLGKIVEESVAGAAIPNDNIYATIEESMPTKDKVWKNSQLNDRGEYKVPRPVESDSMGLLSEIVSELSHRNSESIYSTKLLYDRSGSTSSANNDTYVNSEHYKSPSSSNIYSNYASDDELTSTLYSKVDNKNKETDIDTKPTYAAQKFKATSLLKAQENENTSNPKENIFLDKQGTDMTLVDGKESKKSVSPDLVSSCSNANKNSIKSPDVLASNTHTKVATIKNMHKSSGTPSKYAPVKTTITMPPKSSTVISRSVDKKSLSNNNNSPTKLNGNTISQDQVEKYPNLKLV